MDEKITKIRIRNMYGIKEYDADGSCLELSGKNGTGKSSVLDAIKYALTNRSDREYIVHRGETEGEIIIETDTGLTIDRKVRTDKAPYKSVKKNGLEVGSPETFLKDIFTPLQLNPIEFMAMDKKQQNAMILDMIEYPWDMKNIKEWFGEIPAWVSYDQNILCVLNDIQAENGDYYQNRRNIDREIRNKRAFISKLAESIPAGYDVERWENASVGDLYRQMERLQNENAMIEKAQYLMDNRDSKVRGFEADREISISALDREIANRAQQIDKSIASLKEQIREYEKEKEQLAAKKEDRLEVIEQTYRANVARFDAEVSEYEMYVDKPLNDVSELQEQAKTIEDMKSYINEYRRMRNMQDEVDEMLLQSQELTDKIEKARTLPGEILAHCTIPIDGLTVENGIPLVHGLPVSNLSEGEKLDLCIDVALQKTNGLKIILLDGVEKLATDLREKLYQKCKENGLQFIATMTTDDDEMTAIRL